MVGVRCRATRGVKMMDENVIALKGKVSANVPTVRQDSVAPSLDAGAPERISEHAPDEASLVKRRKTSWVGRTLFLSAGVLAVSVAFYYGHDYWTAGRFLV